MNLCLGRTFIYTPEICGNATKTHVNFGNATFLFGRLMPSDGGVSVEEFLQVEFPEMCVGMLYFGYLRDDEAVVVEGVKKYSDHEGYMKSFQCCGACTDERIFCVLTMDAKNYNPKLKRDADDPEYDQVVSYEQQFDESHILRDTMKARAAFEGCSRVSTGKWGCGQFQGNVYLKFLEQLVAAAQTGVQEFSFSAFSARSEEEQCNQLFLGLQHSRRTPGDLLAFLSALPKPVAGDAHDDVFLEQAMAWLATKRRKFIK